jgi:mannose-6-phosphate isomerase-like protein (cupin superfamily)
MKEKVDKPWGCEIIWAKTEKYVGKMLYINAGEKLSLQYHENKDETIMVDEGRIRITWRDQDDFAPRIQIMVPGDVLHLPPGRIHRMEALESARILEVSTPELEDVVRLKDEYGRV